MTGVAQWWGHLTRLFHQTFRVWWMVLPKLLFFTLAGWLCYEIGLLSTRSIQETHPWVTIVLFSLGLVALLASMIMSIRIAGEAAGLWEVLPPDVVQIGRDEPLTRVVSIALLPFIGVYSVFGGIDKATNTLAMVGSVASETFEQSAAAWVLAPHTAKDRLIVGAVILGAYVLRRVLEKIAEARGWTVCGILGAATEGFFSVVLVFGGTQMLGDLRYWLMDREVARWLQEGVSGILQVLGRIHDLIPQTLEQGWHFLTATAWPLLTDGILAPLLWLAAAGLVHGSYTLTISDLWDKGLQGPLPSFLGRFGARAEKLGSRGLHASAGSKALVLELFEAFYGDLEDRILPFIQSSRHVLRVGAGFVGAYVLCYSLFNQVETLISDLIKMAVGGHEFIWWVEAAPFVKLVSQTIGQPLVMCLLAVAMTATVVENREDLDDEIGIVDDLPGATRLERPGWRHKVTGVVTLTLVTVLCLITATLVGRLSPAGDTDMVQVGAGEVGWFTKGQSIQVVGLDAATALGDNNVAALTTTGVFVTADVKFSTVRNDMVSMTCVMVDADGHQTPSANGEITTMPDAGFSVTARYVYERPADRLADARLQCNSASAFLDYPASASIDLGIDQPMADRMLSEASGKVLTMERVVKEVS
ncbi:hypothetical protein HMPREF1531_00895 [Propionibacterium sp. oral taxon 192 str. F0372]|uniref:hypothetical protein n=1 Tax=Propionibacterium sp. oral taxon 192 TaxID=671222 RepID=UPI000353E577|nr:hypothetical protein [Propionibacterium sp. oral taxon 192]EPH06246.1 hypothetical protein HMPREF1531_00895 [Propionibacterium sp. oral taxon 192 str. F0372]